jgi:hypothetical protein
VILLRNLAYALIKDPSKLSVGAYRVASTANFDVEGIADSVDKDSWLHRPVDANSDSLLNRIKSELELNSMMIIGDSRANMEQKDWVKEISEDEGLYKRFQAYFRDPAPRPQARPQPRSVLGGYNN